VASTMVKMTERRWLSVKNWLVRKKRKVVLASRRRWKRYWVVLRGSRLFFHVDTNQPCTDEHILAPASKEFDSCPPEQVIGMMLSLADCGDLFVVPALYLAE